MRSLLRFSQSIGAVRLLIVGVLLSSGCEVQPAAKPPQDDKELETLHAEVFSVALASWPAIVRSQGSLHADEESVVGAKVSGRIAKVLVDLGDSVNVGDPLVSLDQEEFQLQVDQAKAQLQQSRAAVGLSDNDPIDKLNPENSPPVREQLAIWDESKNVVERADSLRAQAAIAEGEFDEFVAAERVAEARHASAINSVREKIATIAVREVELSLARQRLRDSVIEAPLDGLVQQRRVAVGTYVSAGQPIAIIVRNHPLRFRGTVPERYAQSLQVGQRVSLQIESIGQPMDTEISRISPTLDQQSRALVFEAEVDNQESQIRTGLFAEAQLVIDPEAQAIVIPQSATIEFAGTQKVWKVVDGTTSEQEVLIGTRRDGLYEILQGLVAGDKILVDGSKGRVAKILPPKDT